jgi:UPF0176 protein
MFVVAALYKFADLPDCEQIQKNLSSLCNRHGIKGTLILANEGINGTVAGTRIAVDALKDFLHTDKRFHGVEYKESFAPKNPFYRMKVRLKKEIVTLGVPGINPAKKAGTYVEPEEWNAIIQDPDVVLIDTRNDYEVAIGTFKGAIDPKTTCFTEFPKYVRENLDPKKNKKVAMVCTGGIRCEKASAFMLKEGFETVYHLKGGILKYLENISEESSLWQGDCFVFDQRVAVKHGLQLGDHTLCHGCRQPLSREERASEKFQLGVSCPHCFDTLTPERRKSLEQRQLQVEIAASRNTQHIGVPRPQKSTRVLDIK